jgi:hypothetical protein
VAAAAFLGGAALALDFEVRPGADRSADLGNGLS